MREFEEGTASGGALGKLEWRESGRHARCRDFVLTPREGRPVTGAVWLPDGHQVGSPLVLMGHGASGDRNQPPIPYLAPRFMAEGAAVLALDGPVHGLRQVGPGGRAAFATEMRRPAFLDDMVDDWGVALRALRDEVGLGAGRIAYFGLSMGSIFGVPLLAARDDVHTACIGLLGTTGAVAHIAPRLRQDAARIHIPTLFLMQLEDELFPRDGCLDLFDHLASRSKTLHANPGRHPQVPPEEVDFACERLLRHLRGSAERESNEPVAE